MKILLLTLSVFCFLLFIWNYYQNTYVTQLAYARVPSSIPKKAQTKDDNQRNIDGWSTYSYDFNFITEDGHRKKMNYELSGSNVQPFKPGTYVYAHISNTRVSYGPYTIKNIPKKIIDQLHAFSD